MITSGLLMKNVKGFFLNMVILPKIGWIFTGDWIDFTFLRVKNSVSRYTSLLFWWTNYPLQIGEIQKRFIEGQKEIAKNVYEVDDANYNLENNDSRNVPSRCPLNFVIFPQIIDQTVPYTQ